jgi:squalene cyclase
VPANDPAVAKAVEYLVKLKSEKTYVVSLRTQALARADAKKYATEVQAGADWLVKNRIEKGGKLLGWSYPGNTVADNSNTHFAVMGLHAAARAGAKVDPAVWKQVRDLYAATQHQSGGWMYHNTGGRAAEP